MTDVIVVGGGAAGMLAAGTAAERGRSVTLIEKNRILGKKLLITGKGRCNVTNVAGPDEMIKNVPTNGKFLYSAFNAFTSSDTMSFFEALGVPLKVERGGRVFPASDKSADIAGALRRYINENGVRVVIGRAAGITCDGGSVSGVKLEGGSRLRCGAVILACGGASYPLTGSTGDGYAMAQSLGHTIVPLKPSLVPIEVNEEFASALQGLSLRNIGLKVLDKNGKKVYDDFGEMLFTHFGVSGPVILSASAHMREPEKAGYSILIDLKPALSEEKLDSRIIRDFEEFKNRDFSNALSKLLPAKLIPVVIELSGIAPHKKVNQVTKTERRQLVSVMKGLKLTFKAFRPIEEAIVTSGGVSVKEINPSTMESRIVNGLYFAGEIIDVDAYTGGFNLQIAFSTGRLAGSSC